MSGRAMLVLAAPNAFRGSLKAEEVAAQLAAGVKRALPDAAVEQVALADGGDGTLDVLARLLAARIVTVPAHDALGRAITARLAFAEESGTAVIEMAEASGLRRLRDGERRPMHASTYGAGELVRHALDLGAGRILVGAGGSATIDGGAGALSALGARFLDARGRELEPVPARLTELARVDLDALDARLGRTEIVVLSDVLTTLAQNTQTFGPQKGVIAADMPQIEQALRRLDACAAACGRPFLHAPWLGAGGGIAAGLCAFTRARATSGAPFIGELAGIPALLERASLVLTGEGRVDATTLHGKLPGWIVTESAARGVPAVIIAGAADRGARLPEGTLLLCTSDRVENASDRAAVVAAIADLAEQAADALRSGALRRVIHVGATTPAT